MRTHVARVTLAGVVAATAACACNDPSRPDDFPLLDPDVCDFDEGPFTEHVDNRYFPLPPGAVWILEGMEGDVSHRMQLRVLDEVEKVGEVTTRVLEVAEFEGGELVVISRQFYAQAPDATVCLFGEQVEIRDEETRRRHMASWRADEPGSAPGIRMPGERQEIVRFDLQRAPSVAEDVSAIMNDDVEITVPAGVFEDALWLVDWDPLVGERGVTGQNRFYAKDTGLVVARPVELVSFHPGGLPRGAETHVETWSGGTRE